MARAPGRLDGGRLIGAGNGCAGGTSERGVGGASGTSAGGRGGGARKIESNCADAGSVTSAGAASARTIEQAVRKSRAIEPGCFKPRVGNKGPAPGGPG